MITGRRAMRAAISLLALALWAAVPRPCPAGETSLPFAGTRILYVDSYHDGYPWSDGIKAGILSVFSDTGIDLRILHMDSKRDPSPARQRAAALEAMAVIANFAPEVVIAADDNAQQYLVVPHLLNTSLPVVFCGVNWDASIYGYPAANVTGMLEVEDVMAMVGLFKRDARGERIGYLSGDTATDRKITEVFNSRFFEGRMRVYFARNFDEFKSRFLQAQEEVDMLFLRNYAGIEDWDPEEAKAFLLENTTIPTGSHLEFMAEFEVYTMGKVAEEQGEYAALTALRILGGESPARLPLVENHEMRLVVNLAMADAAGIVLPLSLLRTADVINGE